VESNETTSASTCLCGEARNVNNWPRFWTSEQINDFRPKYEWLSAKNENLVVLCAEMLEQLELGRKWGRKYVKRGQIVKSLHKANRENNC
jgi:hypothetical protein